MSAKPGHAPAPTLSERIAVFVVDTRLQDIPDAAYASASLLVLDAVGVALVAGRLAYAQPSMNGLLELAQGQGDCAVIGFAQRLPMRDAALMNGLLIHGMDFDDSHLTAVLHSTATVLPAALAAGSSRHASGREVLAAFILGTELTARLGIAAGGGFHEGGFHATAIAGCFGATVAAARLMGLDAAQVAMAQGIALSTTSGSMEFLEEGASTKRFHGGWAASAGITCAVLARHGFTGPRGAYEGRFGLFKNYTLKMPDEQRVGAIGIGLGEHWEVEQVSIKPYPACHYVHAPIDCGIALHQSLRGRLDQVEKIRVLLPESGIPIVCEPAGKKRRPSSSYDAQFSIPFTVAAALTYGRFTMDELSSAVLVDSRVLALADKVEYAADPKSGFPKHYSGEIVVEMQDGSSHEHREQINRGAPDRPMLAAEVVGKFRANAAQVLDAPQVAALESAILGLSTNANIVALEHALQCHRR
jgi:2-methylcitrate dehydratase PrpD